MSCELHDVNELPRNDYTRANWSGFYRHVCSNIKMNRHISTEEELENIVEMFTNTVKLAIEIHIPILRYNYSLLDNVIVEIN